MSFRNLKDNVDEIPKRVEEVIKSSTEYYRLFAFNMIAKSAYGFIKLFVFGLALLLVFFFISLAMVFGIGQWLGSMALGFLIVGVFFIILIAIAYAFRRNWIERPLLRRLSEMYFKDYQDDEEQQ